MEIGAVIHMPCAGSLLRDVTARPPHAIILTYSMRSATKSEQWNGKSILACDNVRHQFMFKEPLCVYTVPGHSGAKGNYPADRPAGRATITSGLRLGISDVLRSLRHYNIRGHKAKDTTRAIDSLKERGAENGTIFN